MQIAVWTVGSTCISHRWFHGEALFLFCLEQHQRIQSSVLDAMAACMQILCQAPAA